MREHDVQQFHSKHRLVQIVSLRCLEFEELPLNACLFSSAPGQFNKVPAYGASAFGQGTAAFLKALLIFFDELPGNTLAGSWNQKGVLVKFGKMVDAPSHKIFDARCCHSREKSGHVDNKWF